MTEEATTTTETPAAAPATEPVATEGANDTPGTEEGAKPSSDTTGDEPKGDEPKGDEPKGDEPKGDEPKGDKAGGEEQTSPETYSDFTMPEGLELDAAAVELATPLFKELNLSQEDAQKVVDIQAKLVQEGARKQADAFSQLKEGFRTDAEADSEFGGDKFDENMDIASRAVNAYGNEAFKKLVEGYGLENHPEVIRFMWKVGQTIQEDVPTDENRGAPNVAKDRISLLYPDAKKK